MARFRLIGALAAVALLAGGCQGAARPLPAVQVMLPMQVQVSVQTRAGPHAFTVDLADTEERQRLGLMYRKDIPADGGMLFAPYPPEGGPPRKAFFWMKNCPTSLDIIFIRADGRIASIVDHAVPFSEDSIDSGEPVAAVLEINAGRAAELGIAVGDTVTWPRS